MIGSVDRQIGFSDLWLTGKIPEESYYNRIRKWANENLTEEMFEPLFSRYGRPSISPIYTFTGILVQLEKGYSDRDFELESRFNDLIKYAINAPRDFNGIDANTLSDHRRRFFGSDIGIRVFIDTIEKAKNAGMFDEENLSIIDSFMVWGAAARQSTYTMIYQGIKMVLRVAGFHGMDKDSRSVLKRDDYDIKDIRKPKINWDSEEEKSNLLESLVKDAFSLVDYFKKKEKLPEDLKSACELLDRISRQDIDINSKGKVSIRKGTAEDRIISVVDPEMKHGHKTSSKKSDGYKAEIITGGYQSSIVVAIEVDGANVEDGRHMANLINEAEKNGVDIDKLYGDTAYSNYEFMESLKNKMEFCIKVRSITNGAGLYTKEDFLIDLENGIVTCPAGNTKTFNTSASTEERKTVSVHFAESLCLGCPQREQCTNCKSGRRIQIHPYEEKQMEMREKQKTDEFKEDYSKRSNIERTISHVVSKGGRKSRYIGKEKTKWQIVMASINNNIKKVMGFINKTQKPYLIGEVCPNVS